MARVNVFLSDELLEAIDVHATASRTNRSALIQVAMKAYLEARRKEREEAEIRREMEEAGRGMDTLADKLGSWDPVKVIREFRDSRSLGVREPRKRYRAASPKEAVVIRPTHAKYVLDASVAAKWFTRHDESDHDKAVALRTLHQTGRCRLVVPEFSLLEILNAVRFSARAEEADAIRVLGFLEKLRLEVVPLDWELLRKATAIAWAYQVALYDAAYVALAERASFPLLTADEVMVRKMKGNALVVRLRDMDLS